jgi:hypothetical protein
VAGCALIAASIGELAVKSAVAVDVIVDVLVAIETKLFLIRSAKRLVTRRTLRLQVSMALYQISGHYQRFNALRISSVTNDAGQHCNNSS